MSSVSLIILYVAGALVVLNVAEYTRKMLTFITAEITSQFSKFSSEHVSFQLC